MITTDISVVHSYKNINYQNVKYEKCKMTVQMVYISFHNV